MSEQRKAHVFRTLIADAIINADRPSAGWVRFVPDAENEYHFEMPRAAFEQLGRQIADALKQAPPPSRGRSFRLSAKSSNK